MMINVVKPAMRVSSRWLTFENNRISGTKYWVKPHSAFVFSANDGDVCAQISTGIAASAICRGRKPFSGNRGNRGGEGRVDHGKMQDRGNEGCLRNQRNIRHQQQL